MSQFFRVRVSILWILGLGVLGCTPPEPLNVILIVVDTLRADHLSLYGYERPTSPRLEEWATRGLVFDRAYAPSPWTLPTFGSVLTGLWPVQHSAGSRLESETRMWRRAALSPAVPTLPETLERHGYVTGAIVNNAFLREHFGASRGFGFYDYEKGREARSVVDLAQDWLSDQGQRPFFLMVHLIDPHLPYQPPEEYLGRFGEVTAMEIDEPPSRGRILDRLQELTARERQSLVARYDEEIASVDAELDRLFRFLDETGTWDQTLVILTSDHGEEFFEHGGFEHGHSMHQELLQVPLVVWGPRVRAGREDTPVSLVDVKPTLLEAAGIETEDEFAGESLWSLLQSVESSGSREILAQNLLRGKDQQALIAWPYKLILDSETGYRQLYDLSTDPGEHQNLSRKEPTTTDELQRRLLQALAGLDSPSSEASPDLPEEMEEELRALGYLD